MSDDETHAHAPRTSLTPPFDRESPHVLLEKSRLVPKERAQLLEEYVTRGRALRLEHDRGLIDSHRRRALHLGQFFTPTPVARVLAQALALAPHDAWADSPQGWTVPTQGSLVDFAGCGNGRLLQFAPPGWTLHGADVDALACRAARLVFPEAEIVEASLLEFRAPCRDRFNAAILNPPFSVTLTSRSRLDLKTAQWGIWGADTSIESHVAALELATHLTHVVGAVLPTSFMDGAFAPILKKLQGRGSRWDLNLRIDLPPSAFRDEGTEWPCSLVVLGEFDVRQEPAACATWEDVDLALSTWLTANATLPEWRVNIASVLRHGSEAATLAACRAPATITRRAPAPPGAASATTAPPTVRLALGGRGHRIMFKPNGPAAALAVQEARLWSGWTTADGFDPQATLSWQSDLVRNAGNATESISAVSAALTSLGSTQVIVDQQLQTFAQRADRRTAIELTPFPQWVRAGDTWEERHPEVAAGDHPADPLRTTRRSLYALRAEGLGRGLCLQRWSGAHRTHIAREWPPITLYDFARVDIARVLTKRAALYSAKQGLGKTRFSIGAFLASGMTRGLWVLEARLVNEFRRELRKLGLLHEFHLVDKQEDLSQLRSFNVIAYSRLWRPVRCRHRRWRAPGPPTSPVTRGPPGGAEAHDSRARAGWWRRRARAAAAG